MGEEDVESNILSVISYVDAATGEEGTDGEFILPADAYRD